MCLIAKNRMLRAIVSLFVSNFLRSFEPVRKLISLQLIYEVSNPSYPF